jgi:hypothetical protein
MKADIERVQAKETAAWITGSSTVRSTGAGGRRAEFYESRIADPNRLGSPEERGFSGKLRGLDGARR